ncbi:hypothetical protein ACJX0J_026961, partial [Zea mays]
IWICYGYQMFLLIYELFITTCHICYFMLDTINASKLNLAKIVVGSKRIIEALIDDKFVSIAGNLAVAIAITHMHVSASVVRKTSSLFCNYRWIEVLRMIFYTHLKAIPSM